MPDPMHIIGWECCVELIIGSMPSDTPLALSHLLSDLRDEFIVVNESVRRDTTDLCNRQDNVKRTAIAFIEQIGIHMGIRGYFGIAALQDMEACL